MRSALATALRLGLGARAGGSGLPLGRALELYEFETCPFCRKVREALVWFDLDATINPCPPGGTRFREGRGPFPILVDEGVTVQGSSEIVAHLAALRGAPIPAVLRLGPLTTATTALASALLPPARARPSRLPTARLELFADETSADARAARSWLCSLELPYLWRTAGLGSPKRDELRARAGSDPPVLFDGDRVVRADEIPEHLRRTYGL